MVVEMSGIEEFLLDHLAETKAAALAAAFGYGAEWTSETDDGEGWSVVHADGKRDMVGCEDRDITRHIALHDPARVLADCEAKKQIVDTYLAIPVGQQAHYRAGLGRAVRYLALPFADHHDYREEWKP